MLLHITGLVLQIIGFGLICCSYFTLSKRVSELENSNVDARLKGVEMELIRHFPIETGTPKQGLL